MANATTAMNKAQEARVAVSPHATRYIALMIDLRLIDLASVRASHEDLRAKGIKTAEIVLTANGKEREFTFEEFAALVDEPSAEAATPVEYQYRMRPMWEPEGKGWSEWARCSEANYGDYVRCPTLHAWQYEVRKLYAR